MAAQSSHISIITSHVNGLNTLFKSWRLAESGKRKTKQIFNSILSTRKLIKIQLYIRFKVNGWKIHHENINEKSINGYINIR